jgi:uncharacterized membrane protein YhaH (DUF805 family)
MDWTWYLFGFKGRINRAKYWLAGPIIGCWMIFLMLLLFVPIGYLFGWPERLNFSIDNVFAIFNPHSFRGLSRSDIGAIVVNVITMPLFLWGFFATSVKRLHDRGRSGWWMVPFFIVPGIYYQFQGQLGDSVPEIVLGCPHSLHLGRRRIVLPARYPMDQSIWPQPAGQGADEGAQ